MRKVISVIPARGGSKGIKRKNLRLLNGEPLLWWTIKASLDSEYISRTFVSSDDDEILELAASRGAEVIKRPETLATDSARAESSATHIIRYLDTEEGYKPEFFVLLQPTSPLRNSTHIDDAFREMESKNGNGLISGFEPEVHPLKCMIFSDDGFLAPLKDIESPFMPRQKLPKAFKPNGAIYISETDSFMESGYLLGKGRVPFLMNEDDSIDIDTLKDLEKAEREMKKRGI